MLIAVSERVWSDNDQRKKWSIAAAHLEANWAWVRSVCVHGCTHRLHTNIHRRGQFVFTCCCTGGGGRPTFLTHDSFNLLWDGWIIQSGYAGPSGSQMQRHETPSNSLSEARWIGRRTPLLRRRPEPHSSRMKGAASDQQHPWQDADIQRCSSNMVDEVHSIPYSTQQSKWLRMRITCKELYK